MITGKRFADQARSSKYDKLTYKQNDCQAFVEKVLFDAGCRKPDGTAYNWKGSNSMWRNALTWKGTQEECIAIYGKIPDGAWVFRVKNDGGEKDHGYHDNEWNAYHVGIYVGGDETRDSTKISGKRDGVGYRPLSDWNRVGLCKYIDYTDSYKDNKTKIEEIINTFRSLLDVLEGALKNDI